MVARDEKLPMWVLSRTNFIHNDFIYNHKKVSNHER